MKTMSDYVLQIRSILEIDLASEPSLETTRPLLAHYTSLESLQGIVSSEEVWFANPVLMNDREEVLWGLERSLVEVRTNQALEDTLGSLACRFFRDEFYRNVLEFQERRLLDTYVFCLSEHTLGDTDGLLSMWRGYGADGRGAAIIFDTSRLTLRDDSPMIVGKVRYLSRLERLAWITTKLFDMITYFKSNPLPTQDIAAVARELFDRALVASLFSKHQGFAEEQEWRIVYMPDRDTNGLMKRFFGYNNGPRGLEPKLKFPIKPVAGVTSDDLSLSKLISNIILGPSWSTPLSLSTAQRMLVLIGRMDLVQRVVASSIPFVPRDRPAN